MTPGPAPGLAANPQGMLSRIPARGDSGGTTPQLSSWGVDRPMVPNNTARDIQLVHKANLIGDKGPRPRGGLRLTSAAGGLNITMEGAF
jgi:hypothetical protein